MATMPLSIADQEISPAEDLGDRALREDTEARQAQGTDSTIRNVDKAISTPAAHLPEPDQAGGAESQETTAQEVYNDLPDASLHDCHVVMVIMYPENWTGD
jgi:hypothetical protein